MCIYAYVCIGGAVARTPRAERVPCFTFGSRNQ